jgi:glutamyl-tRNA synthetase
LDHFKKTHLGGIPVSQIRVRFAPSPTGYLHVGGARTALFNWLFARHHGGRFILRIEDTDLERSQESMVRGILEGLSWLGLDWDEGPFFQSQRLDHYRQTVQKLLEEGTAYPCFCAAEELAAKREAAIQAKQDPQYDGTCRNLTPAQRSGKEAAGGSRVIRFKVPAQGNLIFQDAVFARISTDLGTVEDFVLLRSDEMPTYHLGVVVDDLEMEISHVIRGADHISNTPKQILLYQALRAPLPEFAHVPLILGPDKSRLSKRHGATSVAAYRDRGCLPEAFRNFLSLLGWAPEDKKEIMATSELIERFSLKGISRNNAVFNLEKLDWMSAQYIAGKPAAELFPMVRQELEQASLWQEEFGTSSSEWFLRVIDLLKPRAKVLPGFVRNGRPFFSDTLETDPVAREKFLKDPALPRLMPGLAGELESLPSFSLEAAEAALRGYAERNQVKPGLLINAARVLLTGQGVAPGIFEVMVALGRDRTVRRLKTPFPSDSAGLPESV